MGFTPRQIDEMSVWEFVACSDGYSGKSRRSEADIDESRLAAMGIEGF